MDFLADEIAEYMIQFLESDIDNFNQYMEFSDRYNMSIAEYISEVCYAEFSHWLHDSHNLTLSDPQPKTNSLEAPF